MKLLIFALIILCIHITASAQKDGIGGYGELQYNLMLNKSYPNQYLLGGGGVVINNNINIGGYVGSTVNLYNSNIEAFDSTSSYKISNHPYSFTTSASIVDFGLNVGFNVNSQKDFQLLFSLKTGVSIVNIKDAVFSDEYIKVLNDTTSSVNFNVKNVLQTNTIYAYGWNAMPQMSAQFYIGKSMKIFAGLGYRLVVINKKFINPITRTSEDFLVDRWMFNSMFVNFGVSFGSF
jgi:hypothetical protein